ncbi:hypothetical protein GH714_040688 [Hevea brasiliensis]|uniref:BAT2 N-terminal domain-containing protein n=1 Tax=Hevea brasiliensis TaxID=3981 RepID=A0A6A6MUP5_HEVBR|nr:hypothetical protein GH714_040688 [Hevea brasiliensis]
MTVLGKVAVPKPINLPSQENHGLDPNVEIVPKGTHSWGSRSSSSASNAWGSSSLSPNNDGGTGSPSHLSGRPSSGGSGTRPSTAGSDKANEPIVNAWGSNSRPSSSSGALPSNQTSHGALRPRSAETRPGSSQLSRFAEHLSDNSVAWHAMGTADKLGVTSSKNDGFSLTSGDFPTLGSEKDNSGKNADSQDHDSHGHPGSSSASVTSRKEGTGDSAGDVSVHANVKSGADGPWRRENSLYGEDVARTNVEKWYTDHQPYPNSSIPPQHYDSWHGPPVNNHPDSPPALANPQPVPPPGAAPRGPHPKNGDMYRPHLHDAYMRPSVPLRPSFYPGPVPYEGYYGPPMGYCNPNERDVPFMGMAMGPAAYNRYPGQNIPDPGNSHGRTSGYGLSSKAMVLDQVEPVHPQDIRGPYKVLLKQHDGWEGRDEEQKADNRKDHELEARRMAVIEESSSEAVENQGVVPMKVKSPESMGKLNASYDNSVKKFEDAASSVPQVLATPKDSSLIQKIEGLNAKTRASDGRQDVKPVSSVEELKNKFQVGNVFTGCSTNEAVVGSLSYEKPCVSGIINSAPHEDYFSAGVRSLESTIIRRRSSHGMHGRADHRGKGRFNTQEADGWRKKSQVADPQSVVSTVHCEISSVNGQDHNSAEATQNSVMHPSVKDDGESMAPNFEPTREGRGRTDKRAESQGCAKLEELNRRTQAGEGVTQKLENVPAISIQNRQEESLNLAQPTITTSKSGAPSSSFDYNPNTVAQSREKLETLPSGVVQNRHEVAATAGPPIVVSSKSRASSSASGSSPSMAVHGEISMNTVDKSISMASNVPLETPKIVNNESVGVHEQLKPFQPDSNNADAAHSSSAPRVNDSGASKQKRTGNRQKQNSPLEKISNEKLSSSFGTEASKAILIW